jgi:hypothetical protein
MPVIERVWTMPESRVYHERRDCPALTRANRYWTPERVPLSEATGPRPYRGRRRPCRLCVTDAR